MDEQELKARAEELAQVIKTLSDTQTTQTNVLNKLTDGFEMVLNVILKLQSQVKVLEAEVNSLKEKSL